MHEYDIKARLVKREEKALLEKAFLKNKKNDFDSSSGRGRCRGGGRGCGQSNNRSKEDDEDGKGHFSNECQKPKKER